MNFIIFFFVYCCLTYSHSIPFSYDAIRVFNLKFLLFLMVFPTQSAKYQQVKPCKHLQNPFAWFVVWLCFMKMQNKGTPKIQPISFQFICLMLSYSFIVEIKIQDMNSFESIFKNGMVTYCDYDVNETVLLMVLLHKQKLSFRWFVRSVWCFWHSITLFKSQMLYWGEHRTCAL